MKRGCLVGGVLLALIVLAAIIIIPFFLSRYNAMVQADETVGQAWADVENNYQRRLDLIPNLVETVKGVADFERETYTAVSEARAKAGQVRIGADMLEDPSALQRFQEVQGEVSSALSRLLVTIERYPELKANQNFLELQSQLEGTENRIAVSRRRFNETAREFNTLIRVIPNNLIASVAGFGPKAYFEATEGAREAPRVEF